MREANGALWFTISEAATWLGVTRQAIYQWERRGHLNRADARQDERGRRIYTQAQIARAERAARHNGIASRRAA
ncbi:MerR family transcriptional regulator [Streptomyces uncialis]|uniref:MerR family transcriptional regulator n=1 Tax=Streptomyces uncialis TaxID=1048205 RepID=UPI00340FFC41